MEEQHRDHTQSHAYKPRQGHGLVPIAQAQSMKKTHNYIKPQVGASSGGLNTRRNVRILLYEVLKSQTFLKTHTILGTQRG